MLEFLKRRFFGSEKSIHRSPSVRLMLEEFEPRFLPNASSLFGGALQLGFGGSPVAAGANTGTNLSASLSGATGTSGTANYNANATSGQNSLNVYVSGLTADATYTVQINGTTVGQLSTNANGNGQLSLSNVSPSVTSGSAITVLDPTGATVLSGTFASNGCISSSTSSTSSSGTSSSGSSSSSSVSPALSLGSTITQQISTAASSFASDLQADNLSGALLALENFEVYLLSSSNVVLQGEQALTFLDDVIADLS